MLVSLSNLHLHDILVHGLPAASSFFQDFAALPCTRELRHCEINQKHQAVGQRGELDTLAPSDEDVRIRSSFLLCS